MSSLSDRREHIRPWNITQTSSWKDFAATVIFAAIGLLAAGYAIIKGIPLGEYALWGN